MEGGAGGCPPALPVNSQLPRHRGAVSRAATLTLAAILTLAAVVTGFAAAVAFTVVLAFAGMLAGVLIHVVRPMCQHAGIAGGGRISIGGRLGLHTNRGTAEEAGNRGRQDESFYTIGHIHLSESSGRPVSQA